MLRSANVSLKSGTKRPIESTDLSKNLFKNSATLVLKNVHSASEKQCPVQPNESPAPKRPHLVVAIERNVSENHHAPEIQFGAFRPEDFASRVEQARVKKMKSPLEISNMLFEDAAKELLERKRIAEKKPGTINCYRDYITCLTVAFQGIPLKKIHIGHFIEYQSIRKGRYTSANINHHLNTLSQILRMGGLWNDFAEHYHPLPVPKRKPPRVLTDKQEHDFFELAASDPSWWLAYWEASLSNNTTAYGVELRLLQWKDVDMESDQPTITVPVDVKNTYRNRIIPLNERGREMMRRILHRARSIGSTQPEHYIFPFRVKRNFHDPTRPASSSWTNAQWSKLVKRALELKIIPFRISRRNFRNQPITKMLEAGVPIETVRSVAGHVSDEMTRWYDQHRLAAKANAVSAIDPDRKKPQSSFPQRRGKEVGA